MKNLKRIKLINWQTFWNNTIEVKGNILLTGENGSGKTSFLDAINYVLNGGNNTKFNLAASDETTRSLLTYIRGEIGIEGQSALRMGENVISHVALEYYDDEDSSSFIIGAVFEIRDNSPRIEQSFYFINNGLIKEELFLDSSSGVPSIVNFSLFTVKAKELFGEINFKPIIGNRSQIRTAIAQILGIQSKKYHELLAKALAFKPISDVNNFVFNFLLPQENVSVDSVRTTIRSYLAIKGSVELDQKKQIALKDILDSISKYEDLKGEYELLNAYSYYYSYTLSVEEINSKEEKIKYNLNTIVGEKEALVQLEKDIEDLQKRIIQVEGAEWYRAIADQEKVLIDVQSRLSKANEDVNSINALSIQEASLASEFEIENRLRDAVIKSNYDLFKKEVKRVSLLIDKQKDEEYLKLQSLRSEKALLVEKETELMSEISSLDQGLPVYPRSVKTLRDVIHQGIENKYGEDVEAIPFCELIEIKEGEERWRDALEGYLNTRRFDLFVPSKYFDDAVSLYERFKHDLSIEGVGLVNFNAIREREIAENSLASKVVTNDSRALLYVNYLLGDIICVENEYELKNYESSINPTCLVYKNKTIRQTKFDVYKTPYIGQNARLIQKSQKDEELSSIEERASSLTKDISIVSARHEKLRYSKLNSLVDAPNYWGVFDECIKEESRVKKALEKLRIENGSLLNDTSSFKEELLDKKKTSNEKLIKIGALEKENEQFREVISSLIEERDRLKDLYENSIKSPQISIKFDEYVANTHLSKGKIAERLVSLKDEVSKEVNHLNILMNNYIKEFNFDSIPSIENIKDFREEYNLVVKRELSKYQEELDRAMKECTIAFKENYIAQIRQHIKDERENIKKLNKILESKPFGSEGEIYQFVINKSLDPAFGKFYDIFDSSEDFDARDLFINQLSDKNLSLMKELFESLTSDADDEKQAAVVSKFTDYRNFMNYDIMITDKHGNKSFYSKIGKGKSGGETQTPFYVIIAASFDQIVSPAYKNKSSSILVIMDEAFNKMDASHIKATMEYFNDLNIQLLISLPSNNAKILMPFVDTTLGLVKSNNVSYIRSDIKK
ncbi:MAG: SbcC/MukB-like Walker B domain-containing protein [Bacilli bacterium]|nr:SbcC/MukB-like Walker B domain-containing protein [Bacilli bacterium]